VRLHHACLFSKAADGAVLNAGTGVGTTIRELADGVVRVTGLEQPPVTERVAPGEHSRLMPFRVRLPQEMEKMTLDPSKAGRLLDWTPRVSLAEGLREEWEWLRSNPEAWESYRL
jgi:UDP-glucose 4-epimerase